MLLLAQKNKVLYFKNFKINLLETKKKYFICSFLVKGLKKIS